MMRTTKLENQSIASECPYCSAYLQDDMGLIPHCSHFRYADDGVVYWSDEDNNEDDND